MKIAIEAGHCPTKDRPGYDVGPEMIVPGIAIGRYLASRMEGDIKVIAYFDNWSEGNGGVSYDKKKLTHLLKPDKVFYQSQMKWRALGLVDGLDNAGKVKTGSNKKTFNGIELVYIFKEFVSRTASEIEYKPVCAAMTAAWKITKSHRADLVVTILPDVWSDVEYSANTILKELGMDLPEIQVFFTADGSTDYGKILDSGIMDTENILKGIQTEPNISELIQDINGGMYGTQKL